MTFPSTGIDAERSFTMDAAALIDSLQRHGASDVGSECFFEKSSAHSLSLRLRPSSRLFERRRLAEQSALEHGLSIRPIGGGLLETFEGLDLASVHASLNRCAHPREVVHSGDPALIMPARGEMEDLLETLIDRLLSTPSIRSADAEIRCRIRRTLVVRPDGLAVVRHEPSALLRLTAHARGLEGRATDTITASIAREGMRLDAAAALALASTVVERSGRRQQASPPPPGSFPAILAGGWTGVWLHEVLGHLLEADVFFDGPFEDCLGKGIAPPSVTISDDPGEVAWDDEGWPTARTDLVRDGLLQSLLSDSRTARRHELDRTGNGRRQNFRHRPLPRMWGLRLAPGSLSLPSLYDDMDQGVLVTSTRSASIRPGGRFRLEDASGFMIERGKPVRPVAGFAVVGDARRSLQDIEQVGSGGDDLRRTGNCVKGGQEVPVDVSMPPVRFRKLRIEPH